MIMTPYGEIGNSLLSEFCEVAGYKYEDREWIVLREETEYWQLVAPMSTVEEKKWQKKAGLLPIRDLNFQYALCQYPKWIKKAGGDEKVKIKDVEKAIDWAKTNMFDNKKPVYLPDVIEKKVVEKNDEIWKGDKKPVKSYNKIIEEAEELFKSI